MTELVEAVPAGIDRRADEQMYDLTKGLIERVLTDAVSLAENGEYGPWTIQGLGMLRLYIGKDKTTRLHVWDDRFIAEPFPSELHTHPWHLYSLVIAGEVRNTRYVHTDPQDVGEYGVETYMMQRILCGEGGGLCGVPEEVYLAEQPEERISAGEVYKQRANEIHKSNPLRGTVTLVTRGFDGDPDHADVFWPAGGPWVTAEPRPATTEEVTVICDTALRTWF